MAKATKKDTQATSSSSRIVEGEAIIEDESFMIEHRDFPDVHIRFTGRRSFLAYISEGADIEIIAANGRHLGPLRESDYFKGLPSTSGFKKHVRERESFMVMLCPGYRQEVTVRFRRKKTGALMVSVPSEVNIQAFRS